MIYTLTTDRTRATHGSILHGSIPEPGTTGPASSTEGIETNNKGRLSFHPLAISSLALVVFAMAPALAQGQGSGSIEEVILTAPRGPTRASRPALVLDSGALQVRQPVEVADIFRTVTGVFVRTNSRGQTVPRIRGAEERQTLVFVDGAPLAAPWDGRADLSLLPAGLIDRIEVTRGLAPVEYGPNAVAGAIDLVTHVPQEGTSLRAEILVGSLGLRNISAVGGVDSDGRWSFVAGGSTVDRDAERIADKDSVAFDPSTTRARTNTDKSGDSLFAAAAYSGDSFFLRASLLHAAAERGVAAQGDLNPGTASPRFWRMPERDLTQATLNGNWNLREGVDLRFTGWQQRFDQTIDAYRDYSYTALREREQGQDHTNGARLALSTIVDRATLRLVATVQDSTHRQTDFTTATGRAADFMEAPELRYGQRLLTAGIETDLRLGNTLTSTVGLAMDRASTPLTGDKPPQERLSATGWSAGLRWTPSDQLSAVATLGQRSRFPTPRELFGVALGRFLLNPDLQPERSLLADFGIRHSPSDALSLDFTLWANNSGDTLSQRVVTIDDTNRRQRFNLNGSLTYGIEAAAIWTITEEFRGDFSVGLQDGKVARGESGSRRRLLHRPAEQLNLALDWQATSNLGLRAELSYVGRAYDLAEDGTDTRLPASTSIGLRAVMNVGRIDNRDIFLTAAADNLTDALILPQLGLPAPGRSYHVRIRIN